MSCSLFLKALEDRVETFMKQGVKQLDDVKKELHSVDTRFRKPRSIFEGVDAS